MPRLSAPAAVSAARRWTPVVVVYAAILASSAVPGEAFPPSPTWTSVAAHAVSYALLAVAIHRAWAGPAAGAAAIALSVVLGVVNEVQQGLVAGRFPDVADVGVDGLGALGGVLLRRIGRPGRALR